MEEDVKNKLKKRLTEIKNGVIVSPNDIEVVEVYDWYLTKGERFVFVYYPKEDELNKIIKYFIETDTDFDEDLILESGDDYTLLEKIFRTQIRRGNDRRRKKTDN